MQMYIKVNQQQSELTNIHLWDKKILYAPTRCKLILQILNELNKKQQCVCRKRSKIMHKHNLHPQLYSSRENGNLWAIKIQGKNRDTY